MTWEGHVANREGAPPGLKVLLPLVSRRGPGDVRIGSTGSSMHSMGKVCTSVLCCRWRRSVASGCMLLLVREAPRLHPRRNTPVQARMIPTVMVQGCWRRRVNCEGWRSKRIMATDRMPSEPCNFAET